MHWAAKYVGMKYRLGGRDGNEVDCWGLVRKIYREEFHIELPEWPGVSCQSLSDIVSLAEDVTHEEWEEINVPFEGAAVGMSQNKAIHHVGIWTNADGGRIIHCWDKCNTVADTLTGLKLKGFKTIKFYRHVLWPLTSSK